MPEGFHTATLSDLIRGTLDAGVPPPSGAVASSDGSSGHGNGSGGTTTPQGPEAAFEVRLYGIRSFVLLCCRKHSPQVRLFCL